MTDLEQTVVDAISRLNEYFGISVTT